MWLLDQIMESFQASKFTFKLRHSVMCYFYAWIEKPKFSSTRVDNAWFEAMHVIQTNAFLGYWTTSY